MLYPSPTGPVVGPLNEVHVSILRDDATKVLEALAALAEHDAKVRRMVSAPVGTYTAHDWAEVGVTRRELTSVLEERSGILARFILGAPPPITRDDVHEVSP
jgi:hypothetical protein